MSVLEEFFTGETINICANVQGIECSWTFLLSAIKHATLAENCCTIHLADGSRRILHGAHAGKVAERLAEKGVRVEKEIEK